MSAAGSKMDMSLDQIIKLQRKEKKQGPADSGTRGGRGGARGGRGRGRGRGGRTSASVVRKTGNNATGGNVKGRKFGVRSNLAARRMLVRSASGAGRGRGRTTAVQARFARNIVKRAILQNRRAAVTAAQRRGTATQGGRGANNRRLLEDVKRWRNTARQLQRALNGQQKIQPQRPFSNGVGGRARRSAITAPVTDVKERLGWRNQGGRGRARGRGRGGGRFQQTSNVRGRGSLGQMQSDLIMQQNRQVAIRQRGQQPGNYTRPRRQLGQFWNANSGGAAFNTVQQITRGRGRRGGGAKGNRFSMRNANVGQKFNQGGSRPSLHERFGGASTPAVRVNTSGNVSGRRQRQIFFN